MIHMYDFGVNRSGPNKRGQYICKSDGILPAGTRD